MCTFLICFKVEPDALYALFKGDRVRLASLYQRVSQGTTNTAGATHLRSPSDLNGCVKPGGGPSIERTAGIEALSHDGFHPLLCFLRSSAVFVFLSSSLPLFLSSSLPLFLSSSLPLFLFLLICLLSFLIIISKPYPSHFYYFISVTYFHFCTISCYCSCSQYSRTSSCFHCVIMSHVPKKSGAEQP